MKRILISLSLFFILMGSAPKAQAKLLEIWGSGLMGYSMGRGNSYKDFYQWVSGGAVGVEAGVKVIFIGAFIDYLRYFGGASGANLLTFNIGGDSQFDFSPNLSLVLRLAGGYYLGTLPDDATHVEDGIPVNVVNTRGVGFRGGVGLRYTFAKFFSVGVTPEIGYHFFFGGAEDSIMTENSHGWDLNILSYFRIALGI